MIDWRAPRVFRFGLFLIALLLFHLSQGASGSFDYMLLAPSKNLAFEGGQIFAGPRVAVSGSASVVGMPLRQEYFQSPLSSRQWPMFRYLVNSCIVWYEYSIGTKLFKFTRSHNGGGTWESPKLLHESLGKSPVKEGYLLASIAIGVGDEGVRCILQSKLAVSLSSYFP